MTTSWKTVFEPVDASGTYEETVLRLGTAIRIGVLPPATRLPPERELAEQLAISRSTLRQALATLTASGHLTAVRGRAGGTFVAHSPPVTSGAPFPAGGVRALLDRRLALELGVAQLAAERREAAGADRLQRAAQAVQKAAGEGFAAYRRADAALHLALAELARSPRLLTELCLLHGELSDLLAVTGLERAAREAEIDDHRRIVEAVAGGDPAGAVAAMRAHLEAGERMLAGPVPA